jgi:hypothetical protein
VPDPRSADSIDKSHSHAQWRRFVQTFLRVFVMAMLLLYLAILLIDPFDTRFLPSLHLSGPVDTDPRTAVVSRGRDERFDAAIIGNSHAQLLNPARLDPATGLKFVHLTMHGSGPGEQLTAWAWFARHHAHPRAIVLGADAAWCMSDREPPISQPFPFWLYSGDPLDYYLNIFSTLSLERAWRRIALALGLSEPLDPTGYWDYETGAVWAFRPTIPNQANPPPVSVRAFSRRADAGIPRDRATNVEPRARERDDLRRVPVNLDGKRSSDAPMSFPAIARLAGAIEALPADVAVIIVMPPVFYTALPSAGSPDEVRFAHCKYALATLVDGRPHSGFIDLRVDSSLARDPINFMDMTHYRGQTARLIETRIAKVLRDGAERVAHQSSEANLGARSGKVDADVPKDNAASIESGALFSDGP